jgi:hypothetical protein
MIKKEIIWRILGLRIVAYGVPCNNIWEGRIETYG